MKKKYYYDCPIQALYMQKEFGVKFLHWIYPSIHKTEMELLPVGIYYLENIIPYFNYKYAFEHRFIVAPESEHIFEPKDYDSGIYNGQLWTFIARQWVLSNDYEHRTESDNFIKNIVKRDGKHFFNPKEEN